MGIIENTFNANKVKFQTPNYFILMNNIIDCSISMDHARHTLKKKYPALDKLVDDAELERMRRLYNLLHDVIMIRFTHSDAYKQYCKRT